MDYWEWIRERNLDAREDLESDLNFAKFLKIINAEFFTDDEH